MPSSSVFGGGGEVKWWQPLSSRLRRGHSGRLEGKKGGHRSSFSLNSEVVAVDDGDDDADTDDDIHPMLLCCGSGVNRQNCDLASLCSWWTTTRGRSCVFFRVFGRCRCCRFSFFFFESISPLFVFAAATEKPKGKGFFFFFFGRKGDEVRKKQRYVADGEEGQDRVEVLFVVVFMFFVLFSLFLLFLMFTFDGR